MSRTSYMSEMFMPDCIHNDIMSASDRPLLVHVGYHKTGTTWLQNLVFLPEHGFHQVMDHAGIFATVIHPHDLAFEAMPARALMEKGKATAGPGMAVDVISLEALTGLPFDGARESVSYARRLKAIAPDAKILFTIREQIAILSSVYMQYLFRAGTLPPQRFFSDLNRGSGPSDGYMRFDPSVFFYDRLIEVYQDLFGPQNVLVLPLEMIAADQAGAVRLLAEFSGNGALAGREWSKVTERGVSYPQFAVPLLRRLNYFRLGPMNRNPIIGRGSLGKLMYRGAGWAARRAPLPARWADARPVTDYLRGRYQDVFADSNRRLAEILKYPVDLSKYDGCGRGSVPERQNFRASGAKHEHI